jgi:hypothetical protein
VNFRFWDRRNGLLMANLGRPRRFGPGAQWKNLGVGVHHESHQVYIGGKAVISATRCGLDGRRDHEGPAIET